MILTKYFSDFLYKSIQSMLLTFFIEAYVVEAIQISTNNMFYREVYKSTKLLYCALIGACAVIRRNTVLKKSSF